MFDLPFRLFPPALLGGVAIYTGITMLWLQPIVETRLADRVLIPACEASLARSEAEVTNQQSNPQRDLQMSMALLDRLLGETGLDQFPGVGETLDITREVISAQTPKISRTSSIDRSSVCGCAADIAFENAGYSMTLHVGSARTHWPTKVESLPQTTAAIAASGQCGQLPWMKG